MPVIVTGFPVFSVLGRDGRSRKVRGGVKVPGRRVGVTTGGVAASYLVDGSLSYASVVEEYSGSMLSARYDYGADRVRMDRGGAYYYVYDGLGSVRALTNASGAVTDTYAYDAFGNTSHGLGSSANPYQFNGQSNDGTGLYFLRARYYNPGDGRFLSQDPLSGSESDPTSLHRYLYASREPTREFRGGVKKGKLLRFGLLGNMGWWQPTL